MPSLSNIQYNIPENLLRYVGENVPQEQKMTAARGMLPLPPSDLVQVLFALSRERDPAIKDTARKSLLKMPENILKNVAENRNTHPLVLDLLARSVSPDSSLQEAISLNPTTHDETVAFQAGLPNKKVVDIISQNQIRMLRSPAIVDALAENVLTGQAQIDRIIKFVDMETQRAKKKKPGEAMTVEIEEVEEEKPEEEVAAVTEGDEEELGAVTIEESPWTAMTFDEDLLTDHKPETDEEEEVVEKNLTRKIMDMKVSEKIKLALTGGKQARSILIKDSNKMVSSSVLKSPRITESEIETISRSKSVSDEVIRMISSNREWTRSYQVKLNLVSNPKTPLPESMRFMNHLRDKDLRDLARSRNIPSQVATQAKRLLQRKELKARPGAKH